MSPHPTDSAADPEIEQYSIKRKTTCKLDMAHRLKRMVCVSKFLYIDVVPDRNYCPCSLILWSVYVMLITSSDTYAGTVFI